MHHRNRVLVTGGRGFIGTNLVRALAATRPVRVFDSLERSSPTGWSDGDVDSIHASILDDSVLPSALEGVDSLVHLAAYGSVVESVKDPTANFHTNVLGTFNVLHAAANAGVRRVVFASTGGALIGDATPPVNEDSLPKPISPYGASKLCGEAYCHAFAMSRGLRAVCLRFGNVYGPHSAHKKGAVTMFIKALMLDEPIVIYGDGSASRDYIHVNDLCAGIEAALDSPLQGGEVFHVASGRETTVLELANILRDAAGKPNHPIEFRASRVGEVARNFAAYDLARQVLGFEPKRRLEEGLAETWQWFADHRDIVLSAKTSDS
ncbi:MAG TPA: NAD-dependent epimerase/dehydratase family protein [Xanthomonadaceae bacterium]|jgi:UDP-glucose 4-epimerase|nr:NAD-dependent epimerase/dehydratase family protein [Xanthomonadaceae bacterium]